MVKITNDELARKQSSQSRNISCHIQPESVGFPIIMSIAIDTSSFHSKHESKTSPNFQFLENNLYSIQALSSFIQEIEKLSIVRKTLRIRNYLQVGDCGNIDLQNIFGHCNQWMTHTPSMLNANAFLT